MIFVNRWKILQLIESGGKLCSLSNNFDQIEELEKIRDRLIHCILCKTVRYCALK